MKINKKNPFHWLSLGWMVFLLLLLLPTRLLRKAKRDGRTIILYGHKLHGNLNALYDYSLESLSPSQNLNIFFLTMDPHYFAEIKKKDNILFALKPLDLMKVIQADCIISDHGLHALLLLLKLSDITFVDVWHGIPFKGFTAGDFSLQHQYDEIWVSSALLKKLYVEKFGFEAARVQATGYGRTDLILHYRLRKKELREQLGITAGKKVILFAPTWKQDEAGRSEIPFNLTQNTFLQNLEEFAAKHNASFIIRYHLNTSVEKRSESPNIFHLPLQEYPNGEELVAVSDVLITDWSSIAFDMMVLDKPIVFLDVAPPFKNGFSLPPEYRVGDLVESMEQLLASLAEAIRPEENYMKRYDSEYRRIKSLVYDDTIDGNSTGRYLSRLETVLS
ncbi:MAG: CDP-glycerol glycerophosphotransferase family protein [Desulfuromusa sp.]|nr:CDP-glycerol glycerophosphotransferase family protein [Desulfuromusa sp.]